MDFRETDKRKIEDERAKIIQQYNAKLQFAMYECQNYKKLIVRKRVETYIPKKGQEELLKELHSTKYTLKTESI